MLKTKIYLAGDSTVANYPKTSAPMAGWGQFLHLFVKEGVEIVNEATNGRSSKSFIEEGRLEKIQNNLKTGDYVFIQFGHNDQKSDERGTDPHTTYPEYLKKYLNVAKSAQAHPILITPVERRRFSAEGEFLPAHGEYPNAVKALAIQENIALIDLRKRSQMLMEELGHEQSKLLFTQLEKGEHPNYPEGVIDNTHFNESGAKEIAKLVVKEIHSLNHSLKKWFI
ncbi:putative esterase [Bacillus sp. TS-2]|nr:putative esterase [Bacillus sp. TS-2]